MDPDFGMKMEAFKQLMSSTFGAEMTAELIKGLGSNAVQNYTTPSNDNVNTIDNSTGVTIHSEMNDSSVDHDLCVGDIVELDQLDAETFVEARVPLEVLGGINDIVSINSDAAQSFGKSVVLSKTVVVAEPVEEAEPVVLVKPMKTSEIGFHFDQESFEKINDLDVLLLRAKYIRNDTLENKDRNRLAKCLIKHFLSEDTNKQFDRQDFIVMANVIKEVFPNEEVGSYFIPSDSGVLASGSLYYAYRWYRDELGAVGLIKMRSRKKRKVEETTSSNQTEDTGDSNKILESRTDPKDLVQVHWVQSRATREKMLQTMSNSAYVSYFPVLQMGNGFEWIIMDFDAKFSAPNILESWPGFAATVMKFASSYRNKSEHLKLLLNSPEAKSHAAVMAIKILPLILKTPTKGTKPKKNPKKGAGKKSAVEDPKDTLFSVDAVEGGEQTPNKTFRASKPEVALDFIPHYAIMKNSFDCPSRGKIEIQ